MDSNPTVTSSSRRSGGLKGLLRRWAYAYLERKERRRRRPREVIWLLGHMRSGSTLLMHLLSSHPQILGAGERNAVYSSADDLRRLAIDAAYTRRQLLRDHRYVVDQINHGRFLESEELLDQPRVAKIFLVREPEGALASMVEVLGRHYGMTLEQAVDYYLERLDDLARYARRVEDKESSLFLTYGDLVAKPGATLRRLESFLDLPTPLSERYRTFGFTGRRGDPSSRIRSGRILKERPRRLDLEPALRDRLTACYSRCTAVLDESSYGGRAERRTDPGSSHSSASSGAAKNPSKSSK